MHLQLPPAVRQELQHAKILVLRRVRESLLCRECGKQVHLLADVCDHCGAGNPVKIHISPVLLLTAIACEAFLIMLSLR
jgi:predicted amidophosphoribosyltransferase